MARPARITVAVLNYIPMISGFYAEMPDVLRACLDSIYQNTDLPHDLMVFDNGSCKEVRQFLMDEHTANRIQYLLLSEKNLGKGGAWNIILSGAPGEIIAYSDNDVLYSKGWLSRSVQVLETFPNVGMVTARPFRSKADLFTRTVEWARQARGVKLEEDRLIPWESFLEFNLSLGHTEAEIRQIYETTRDYRVTYRGVTAYLGASHWQFVTYKSTLQEFLPLKTDKPMGQLRRLDKGVNDRGYLRLMVSDPLVMNMSNTPMNKYYQQRMPHRKPGKLGRKMLDFPPVKKVLMALYNRLFRWYYD